MSSASMPSTLSFWERESFSRLDIAIVGGGIVGMSVAASVIERWPDRQVTIIERSSIPYGASTRNAGFACFGSLTEVAADIQSMGSDNARELLFDRWLGLKITRDRLKQYDIGYNDFGGYEIIDESLSHTIGQIDAINELVEDFIPDYLQILPKDIKLGLRLNSEQQLVSMAQEGQVDTGKLLKSMYTYCSSIGVEFLCGLNVNKIESKEAGASLIVDDAQRGTIEMSANQVVLCTNAFTQLLAPEEQIDPGRGQVLITKPINGLKFRGNLHLDEGFYYLRNVGNRILFGGGRNLDRIGETKTSFDLNDSIQTRLDGMLEGVLELNETPQIDMRWSGIMAFGKTKMPIVRLREDGLLIATKMSGMGIALAGQIGEQLADLMDDKNL